VSSRIITKRMVVMISSTARDLPKHREEVRLACVAHDFDLKMMEHLTAENRDAIETSLSMVEAADVYLGIFAHRYGYIPPGCDVSITEMEYNRATKSGKPCLMFIIDQNVPILPEDFDTGPSKDKLDALKNRIRQAHVIKEFTSPGDLRAKVGEALNRLKKDFEATKTGIDANSLRTADCYGLSGTAARHLPREITLIATSIDRKLQYGSVMDFLEGRLASSGRPSLIVLHGSAAESHYAFVSRCESDIQEILSEPYIPFGRCDWPANGSRLESVLRSLNEPLFHLSRRAGRIELEARLQGLGHSGSFSHHVDASGWEARTAELIDSWIQYCREEWPELPRGRLLVAFLCIELPAKNTKQAKAARSFIEGLRKRYRAPDPCLLITEELQPIRRMDVADWISYARKIYGDKFNDVAILDAPMWLFPDGRESRPLEEIYQELFELLHMAYRPAPIFAER